MKKLLTLFTLLLTVCSGAWADTTVSATQFTASQSGTTYTVSAKSGYGSLEGIIVQTIGSNGGVGSNRLKVPKGTLNISATGTNVIKSVTISWRNSNGQYPTSNEDFTSSPTGVSTTDQTSTWTGSAASVVFTNTTDNTFQIVGLSVTYGSAATYKVTYKANGGEGEDFVDNSATTILDVNDCSFTAPSGKAFAGWKDSEETSYAVGATVTEDLTLFAQWDNVYTVTFNLQGHGDAIDAQNIINGGKVTEPTAPTASGYDFGGWYKEAGCENAWNFDTDVVTETKTLFAKWTEHVAPTYGNIFSASGKATLSVSAGASGSVISDSYATISGGSMYAYNGQSEAKNLINNSKASRYQFQFTNDNTYFKVVLNDPLKPGDVISAKGYHEGNGTSEYRGIFVQKSSTIDRENPPAAALTTLTAKSYTTLGSYTVVADDDYDGATELYIVRATGNSTWFNEFTINRPASVTITDLSSVAGSTYTGKNYATLYYSDAAIAVPAGVKAYTYKIEGGNLTVSRTYENGGTYPVIPAGEAVVLETETGASYNFNMATTATTVDTESLLAGSDAETTVNEPGYKYYKLSMNDDLNKVGFYFAVAGGASITNGAHKAYLAVPAGGDAKNFFVLGGEDEANNETTAINAVDIAIANGATIYNLAGQKVGANYKGIVVINGKKVVRK